MSSTGEQQAEVCRNAADRLMKSRAMELCSSMEAIAIISADAGFAETARHCREAGCSVLVMGV